MTIKIRKKLMEKESKNEQKIKELNSSFLIQNEKSLNYFKEYKLLKDRFYANLDKFKI